MRMILATALTACVSPTATTHVTDLANPVHPPYPSFDVKSSGFCEISPMPACSSEQGGSHRRGGASTPQTNGDISNAYQEIPERKTTNIKKQKCTTIIEEVERFEDLGPRREFIFALETT
jgi:hypothetical protein